MKKLQESLRKIGIVATTILAFLGAVFVGTGIYLEATRPAFAQTPSTNPPYNTDLGALITNAARGAGTVQSASQTNLDGVGVICTFYQNSHTGTPSTTFGIQIYDAASLSWQQVVVSGAITADATPTTVSVTPGAQTASLPTGWVSFSMHLPRAWRVFQTIAGTTPGVTGHIGCNKLK